MEQESPDELRGMQSHYFILVLISIITPEKKDLPILHFDDEVIADGQSCGYIFQDSQGASQGL